MQSAASLLNDFSLRKTAFRIQLLNLFRSSTKALSVEEIRAGVEKAPNKATVYRALEAFEVRGLVHQVPGGDAVIRYALCQDECGDGGHVHSHAHFICNQCGQTTCVDQVQVPEIPAIKGFRVDHADFVLKGQCAQCAGTGDLG